MDIEPVSPAFSRIMVAAEGGSVRVATREVEAARRALHRFLGEALGIHTVDIDRRRDLACLHVEIERERVGEAMSLLIRTLSSAEFGTIRRLER